MHETHLIEPIIKGICEHAKKEGAKRVTGIKLKVGMLLGVSSGSFTETFKVLSKGTCVENAALDLVFFPGSRVEVISFDIEENTDKKRMITDK